jgi:hypothetical protein
MYYDFTIPALFEMCDKGIDLEIEACREFLNQRGLGRGLEVHGGMALDDSTTEGGKRLFIYEFHYVHPFAQGGESGSGDGQWADEIPVELQTGAQCSFRCGALVATGRIQHHDAVEQTLVVGLEQSVGDGPLEGRLTFDLTYLLKSLQDRIEKMHRKCEASAALMADVERFFFGEWNIAKPTELPALPEVTRAFELNAFQRQAVRHTLADEHHLVWGPPGTGKTRTLASAALTRVLSGANQDDERQKILVLSYTNVALDNAVSAIIDAFKLVCPDASPADIAERAGLVRLGPSTRLDEEERVWANAAFDRLAEGDRRFMVALATLEEFAGHVDSQSLKRRAARTLRRVHAREESGSVPQSVSEARRQLERRMNAVEMRALDEAPIVCATLSQLHLRADDFIERNWTAAYVDELSIAGVARLVPVVELQCPIFGFGDFMQLPPIVRSSDKYARRMLGTHLFELLGLDDAESHDGRRTMLERQYRMARDICRAVSSHFYKNRLQTADVVDDRQQRLEKPIGFVDSRELGPEVVSAGTSKRNAVHAQICARLVRTLLGRDVADIGVISPYGAQAEAIKRELSDEISQVDALDVSTVHSYQGREKQVVIFDAVVAPGERLGFLDDVNPSLENLLNVAISRARECVIPIYDSSAMDEMPANGVTRKVLQGMSVFLPKDQCLRIDDHTEPLERFVDSLLGC